MGHNEYMSKVLGLQKDGYDFLDNKRSHKSESRMIKWRDSHAFADICVVTMWDDDSVTEACEPISAQSIHAGFV